jgi:hypothetical protein
MNRRDQKKGQQTAVVGRTSDGDLEVTVHWDEPNPGKVMLQQQNALRACAPCNSCVALPEKHTFLVTCSCRLQERECHAGTCRLLQGGVSCA